MIVQLSNFLRYSLESDPVQPVTLEEELDALRLYLNIEQTRFGERLRLHFDVDKAAEEINVPSLLLQPLVELIKYAVAPMEEEEKSVSWLRLMKIILCLRFVTTVPVYI